MRIIASLFALVLAATPAAADVMDFQASKDNTLYQDAAGGLSNGVGQFLFSGATDDPRLRRAVIAFDVAGSVPPIPPGATITSVTLTLTMSKTQAGAELMRLHRVLADWGEGTSNAGSPGGGGTGSTMNDATWVHRFFNTAVWANPGGDFVGAQSAVMAVAGNAAYTWGPTPEMINDVQLWLDTPGMNFGWIVVGNETGRKTAKRFNSREHANAGSRPLLHVEYTVGGVGPTVYESLDPVTIVQPANAVGTAFSSPYDHAPALFDMLFYQVDDGVGNPALIQLVPGGLGLQIHYF